LNPTILEHLGESEMKIYEVLKAVENGLLKEQHGGSSYLVKGFDGEYSVRLTLHDEELKLFNVEWPGMNRKGKFYSFDGEWRVHLSDYDGDGIFVEDFAGGIEVICQVHNLLKGN
jgi:hypothetical protein